MTKSPKRFGRLATKARSVVVDPARGLTHLFGPPQPIVVGRKIFDGKHIHRSRRSELMISKSEAIIATKLQSAGLDCAYGAHRQEQEVRGIAFLTRRSLRRS
ncbi:hypothetical protein [Mesorhizobium cantuariense]|uniref:Uncharacterized protein n=1 Tax=Mesorhizobium cantuariense TaxID=1300275 RepID=A0ABV7MZH8_9HYPH